MFQNNRQLLCTLLAVSAPLAHYSGVGYMAVLLAAGAMLPLTVLAGDGLRRVSGPEAALELLWLGVAMGSLIGVSGANWPGEKADVVVPVILLILTAVTGNRERSLRSCSTLFWIIAVPGALVLTAMTGKLEPEWMKPEPGDWTGGLIAALLYPSLNGTDKETDGKQSVMIGLTAVALATLIQGGLGIAAGKMRRSPLYELGRCIGNGGFEIIVSVVLTISWYGFASMGMRAAESLGKRLRLTGTESRILVSFVAAVTVVSGGLKQEWLLITGCLTAWILIPILHPKK